MDMRRIDCYIFEVTRLNSQWSLVSLLKTLKTLPLIFCYYIQSTEKEAKRTWWMISISVRPALVPGFFRHLNILKLNKWPLWPFELISFASLLLTNYIIPHASPFNTHTTQIHLHETFVFIFQQKMLNSSFPNEKIQSFDYQARGIKTNHRSSLCPKFNQKKPSKRQLWQCCRELG